MAVGRETACVRFGRCNVLHLHTVGTLRLFRYQPKKFLASDL